MMSMGCLMENLTPTSWEHYGVISMFMVLSNGISWGRPLLINKHAANQWIHKLVEPPQNW